MRANGWFHLEPSFLSLYSSLCIILLARGAVKTKRGLLWALILTSGLLSSVAVSGVVLLPIVVLSILLLKPHRAVLVMVIIGAAFLLLRETAVATAFVDKLFEDPFTETGDVSAAARLYRPYLELIPSDFWGLLLGEGPGGARNHVDALRYEVTTPTLAKLLYEYGLISTLIFVGLVICTLARAEIDSLVAVALGFVLLIPTDGVTHPTIAGLILCVYGAGVGSRRTAEPSLRGREGVRV